MFELTFATLQKSEPAWLSLVEAGNPASCLVAVFAPAFATLVNPEPGNSEECPA